MGRTGSGTGFRSGPVYGEKRDLCCVSDIKFRPGGPSIRGRHSFRTAALNTRAHPSPEDLLSIDALAVQAAVISHARLAPAATAFASELAIVLGADRVAVGFVEDHFVQVVALSHGLAGREGSQELRVMGAAMDEAVEQRATVALPARAEDLPDRKSVV